MRSRTRAIVTSVAAAILIFTAHGGAQSSNPAPATPAAGSAAAESAKLERYTWDLASIYPNEAALEAERTGILAGIDRAPRLRAIMASSPAALTAALDEISKLRAAATRLEIYGELAHNLDKNSADAERWYQVGTDLISRVESAVAFSGDEIRKIGNTKLTAWYRTEPRLEKHRIRITRVRRDAPHTLPGREQAIVASMARWPFTSSDIFEALHDADLGWPTMKNAEGRDVPVNSYSFRLFPRESRAESARLLLTRLKAFQTVFGILYTRRIEADLTIARHQRFAEGIDAIWFLRDGMPPGSARLAADAARRNLPLFQRYLRLRSRALGFAEASFAQLYVPPSDAGQTFGVDETLDLAVASCAPLGSEFQQRMRAAIAGHWMHLPPWPQKRGIFEVFPAIGKEMPHPFMLTSFQPTYRGARQVAGALLDMMKDASIPADRTPDSRDDPPVYGNGIIYVGTMLFDDLVRSRASGASGASGAEARLVDAVQALDAIWNNFFATTLMMELDMRVQKLVLEGRPPGGEEISRIYLSLLREYAGSDVKVDDWLSAAWMVYPTAFYSYEHQFWAGAFAAGADIVEKIHAGDPNGRRAVDHVYGFGDSDRSYYLLRQAGIDMARPEAYGALMRRMEKLLAETEGLLAAKR